MKNTKTYEQNQRLLIEAFNAQNIEAYDEAYEKLQVVSRNLISLIEGIDKNTEFYMRVMPVLKHERELVSQKDYKQFMHKNEKVLMKNLEQNAYFALLMQEMEQKCRKEGRKWSAKEDALLGQLVAESYGYEEIAERFADYDAKEVRRKYQKLVKRMAGLATTEEKEKR